jgi:hypothetical protein
MVGMGIPVEFTETGDDTYEVSRGDRKYVISKNDTGQHPDRGWLVTSFSTFTGADDFQGNYFKHSLEDAKQSVQDFIDQS